MSTVKSTVKRVTLIEVDGQWKVAVDCPLTAPLVIGDLAKIQRALRMAHRLYVKGLNLKARLDQKETTNVA